MAQLKLIAQYPKPHILGLGTLCISKTGLAEFYSGDCDADSVVLCSLERIRIEYATSEGIMISGVEKSWINSRLSFQEWWLVYV